MSENQVACILPPPPGGRVVVAMSGGVDSAAAAAVLVEQGYDCIGVTLRLIPDHPERPIFEPCCGLEAAGDARRVCAALGIEHRVIHLVDQFEHAIIDHFLEEYAAGRTPNPCIRCNRLVKFGLLYQEASKIGAQYVATGHFARLEARGKYCALRRGADAHKDQSYALAALDQNQLRRAWFPVGHMTKAEVRAFAQERNLPTANKPESQEICFIPGRGYGRFIEQRRGPAIPGPILSPKGKLLGQHRGLMHYTIGQRQGLGIAAPRPLYVLALDIARNALIAGFEEETYCQTFRTGPLVWGGVAPSKAPIDCHVQLRSRHHAAPATLISDEDGAQILLHQPQRSVTPGQWAVCYDGEFVIASGIIRNFTRLPAQNP